jgi:hypothetical protein
MSLEELREQASSTEFLEEAPEVAQTEIYHERRFLGLTAFQRFVIAMLLFMVTCMISSFILLVTQRVVLPFF